MSWYPHKTVATVVEQAGRFLMVEERADGALVINQPAGHLEAGETLIQAAQRETLEETGWEVEVTHFLGLYHYFSPASGLTYIRSCFIASAQQQFPQRPLDRDIERCLWLRPEEIQALGPRLRSPMVWQAVADYLQGIRYPLQLIHSGQLPRSPAA